MPIIQSDDSILYAITLHALINSLHKNGFDLENILVKYNIEISDGCAKSSLNEDNIKSVELLKNLMDDVKANSLQEKDK